MKAGISAETSLLSGSSCAVLLEEQTGSHCYFTCHADHRDVELAKFEAFLNREQCKQIKALVRGRQQLAYPIKG